MADFEITVTDVTSYEWQRSRNGGAYWFRQRAKAHNGQIVDGAHTTSADFDYCPYCGNFERNLQEHEEQYHPDEEYLPSAWMEEAIREVDIALETGATLERATQIVLQLFEPDNYEVEISLE